MKICMLNKHFHPWLGGREKQVKQLCAKLQESDSFEVSVLTTRFQKELSRSEFVEGVPLIRVNAFGRGWLFDLTGAISTFIWLIVHGHDYEIFHIHNASCIAFPAIIAGKLLRKKTILTKGTAGQIDNDFIKIKRSFISPLLFEMLRHLDVYIAVSTLVKKEIIEYGFSSKKIACLPNGVNIDKYKPISPSRKKKMKELYSLPPGKIVTFIGRLIFRKGVDVLLEAWQHVISVCPDVHLAIVGEGPEIRKLRALAKKFDVSKKVSFLGRLEPVYKVLQASDIFVFPTRQDALPNAILEAMASGLPTVATAVDGNIEIIEHRKNGILVKLNSPEDLASALLGVIRNPKFAESLGKQARATICARYTLTRTAIGHEKIYNKLANMNVSSQSKNQG